MLSKLASPSISKGIDQGKFKQLAQRVVDSLTNEILFHEPKQLDPCLILVSPLNRDGAPPNVQHIHFKILKGFLEKGFDRTRPAVGICVKYLSEQGKKDNKLLPLSMRRPCMDP